MKIYGRDKQIQIFQELLNNKKPAFMAIYGRRRIGKTYLVTEFFKEQKCNFFHLTGVKKAKSSIQLENFKYALEATYKKSEAASFTNWNQAFVSLSKEIKKSKKKTVLFFDEVPWLTGGKSDFLLALDHFWNHYLSSDPNVICIVCGSSASWIIKKIIKGRYGFHHRLTHKIHLHPFDLYETEGFLKLSGLDFGRQQIIELYFAIGGVAKYLTLLKPNLSVVENIQEIIFSKEGLLYDEFEDLYSAIFNKHENYVEIVKLLGQHHYGMTRDEIKKALGVSSGGSLTKWLEDLETADFITAISSYKKNRKEKIYLLTDEFSRFYLTWFAKGRRMPNEYWLQQKRTAKYKTWAGLAFEVLCVKHIDIIKSKLGITGIQTTESFYKNENCQIDLLIEREDRCINICEMKYSISLDLNEVKKELNFKKESFNKATNNKKQLLATLITNDDIKLTGQQREVIQKVVVI